MPKIIIDEELAYLTNNQTQIENIPGTVKNCMSELFCKYPQLYVFLMDNQGIEAQKVMLIVNDEELLEGSDTERVLTDQNILHIFYGVPFGNAESIAVFAAEMGASMATATAIEVGVNFVISAATMAIVSMAVSYAISAIIGALVDDVATPESTIAGNSATYTFDGVKNTTASGTPVGIVYGTHRTGGQILGLTTKYVSVETNTSGVNNSQWATQTYLYYHIGLSEGEVADIPATAIEINKLPISYFHAVDVVTDRRGTRDQAAMPDFNTVELTNSLNRKVLAVANNWTPPVNTNVSRKPVYGAYYNGEIEVGPGIWVAG